MIGVPDGVQADAETDLSIPENVAWAFRKLRDAKSRIAEEHATAEAMRAKLRQELSDVDEWEGRQIAGDTSLIAYMESQLEAHLRNRRLTDDGVKSVATPWGRVASREQQPDFQRNDETLLAWLEANQPQLVRVTTLKSPAWDDVKKWAHVRGDHLVTPDGEVIPGVTVTERPLKVTVEVAS